MNPMAVATDVKPPEPLPIAKFAAAPRPQALSVRKLLPPVLADWTEDRAERMNAPVEFVAVAALVTCAGAVGNRVVVAPDPAADPTWLESLNLWGLLIGDPGAKKTPVLEAAMRPLTELEGEHAANYRKKYDSFELELEQWRAQPRRKKGEPAKEATPRTPKPKPPAERAILAHDITPEKLADLLVSNPEGLVSSQDELLGLIATWDKQERAGERQFYLKLWSGLSSHSVRRIGRGSQHLPIATLSLIGGAQPGPFARYVLEAAKGFNHDGLLVRFQLLVMAELPPYQRTTRPPDETISEHYRRLVRSLAELNNIPGAPRQTIRAGIERPRLTFEPAALEHFLAWREQAATKARNPDCSPLTRSLIEKQPGLVARLAALLHLTEGAALLHLTEGAAPLISENAMLRALAWSHLLREHAEAAFWGAIRPEASAAQRLAGKIKAKTVTETAFDYRRFTARDVLRSRWTGLTTAASVNAAIAELESAHWLIKDGSAYVPNARLWHD